jgi:hypothetical protein
MGGGLGFFIGLRLVEPHNFDKNRCEIPLILAGLSNAI